jgi:hypothetical protein
MPPGDNTIAVNNNNNYYYYYYCTWGRRDRDTNGSASIPAVGKHEEVTGAFRE